MTDSHLKDELELEVARLAELLSDKTEGCSVGPWCKDCRHMGTDVSQVDEFLPEEWVYIDGTAGRVMYCKKHLHEVCPEFEMR